MKKICLFILCFALLIQTAGLYAASFSVDAMAEKSVEKLTADYIKKYPTAGMKKGLAVLTFSEESTLAKESGLGNTVREIVTGLVTRSQVFFLIDRDTLENRMQEIELSMTGITDDSMQAGRQAGVAVFLSGSVSEIESDFLVTVKMIDTETGNVTGQETFRVPRTQMIKKQEQIAYAYIAQHGIGINWQTSYLVHPKPMGGVTLLNDIFVSYRPTLEWNIKLGFTHIYLEMWDDAKVDTKTLYPNTATLTSYTDALTGYTNGKINQAAPYIGAEYNIILNPSFIIGVGLSTTIFMPNTLKFEQIYTGNPVRTAPYSGTPTGYKVNNTMIFTQTFDPAAMFRVEIKPQYFISPRATIGLYIAATCTTPLKVDRTDFGDGIALYPHDSEGKADPTDMHAGFKATQMGLDKDGNVEDDLKLMGCAFGLSVSFYF